MSASRPMVQGSLDADVVIEMRELLAAAFAPLAGDKARQLAEVAELVMRGEWGGENIYFPTGSRYHTEYLRKRIKSEWNGRNTRELAHELGITPRRLQQIGAEARQRAQGDLLDSGGDEDRDKAA